MSDLDPRVDLVFEGGGVKGIGLAGAFGTLWQRGYRPQCVAGTSAGAITAALVAAGYSGEELQQIVLEEMDFTMFADPALLDHFGVPGDAAEFLSHRGMHSGDYFLGWIKEKLAAKGKNTFGDLRDDAATSDSRRHRLQVIASDLSAQSMLVLPRDAAQLGYANPDDLPIAEAVRMSMSIPVFFVPVTRRDSGGQDHTIVDGGLLSNFPVWLFDTPPGVVPEFPTFGLLLQAPNQSAPLIVGAPEGHLAPVTAPVDFVKAIVDTMMEAHDRLYVDSADYARTIPIPTLGVGTTEFDIQPAQKQALFESGARAATTFLASWNFDAYRAQFRSANSAAKPQ
jgi:NTE family protein